MLQVKSFVFNPFQENTYILYDETNEAVIIDAGCYNISEFNLLKEFIASNKLDVKHYLNTHCHIDHILGNNFVCKEYNLKPKYSAEEIPVFNSGNTVAKMYGLNYTEGPVCKDFISEGDTINFGNIVLNLIHLPGHSPGSIGFYDKINKVIICGDVLFQGSIGRTDLPLGNHEDLLLSIQTKLFTLPHEVKVYAGHGNATSIGEEIKYNPFFN
jgi:glyoxylase-like metal-dependent hydrolase (beta-lactamase superfamily II)